jgi:hypothetical protein
MEEGRSESFCCLHKFLVAHRGTKYQAETRELRIQRSEEINKAKILTFLPHAYLSLSFFFTCLFEFFCVTVNSESWLFSGCSSGSDRQVATGGTRMALESSVIIKPLDALSLWCGFKTFRIYPVDNITAAEATACFCMTELRTATIS